MQKNSFVAGASAFFNSPDWRIQLIRIVLICAAPTFLFLYHDPNRHFLWTPDWDLPLMNEALLLNSGLKNNYESHFGYGMFFVISKWFQLLNFAGVLDVITVEAIPPAPESDAVFQILMYWTRVLTLFIAAAFVIIIMLIAQIITGSQYYGFLAALALSGTQSFNTHVLAIRAEMLSAASSFLAILLILMAVTRANDRIKSLIFVGLSAFFVLFALYAKIASLPIVLLLPLFPLFFSHALKPAQKTAPNQLSKGFTASLIAFSIIAGYFSLAPFIGAMSVSAYFYNGLIVLYVIACIAIYVRMNGFPQWDIATSIAAIVIGFAAAQYMLVGSDPHSQSTSVANHVGYMAGYTIAKEWSSDAGQSIGILGLASEIASKLVANFMKVMTESYFNFCWVCRRPSIIYLLTLITFGVVLRKYRNDDTNYTRLSAAFLVTSLILIEMVMWFHHFNNHYRMFVEGLLMATMVFMLVRIAERSSINARKVLAGVSLVFAVWFWFDDVNRKMLWPTFAPHVGAPRPYVERTPLIADRFDAYFEYLDDYYKKMKSGELPPGSVPPWWQDNRSFLGVGKPWRRWDDK